VTISASVTGSIVASSATSWRPSAAVASSKIAAVVASGMIPTVPGPPVIADAGIDGEDLFVGTTAPDDGGSAITAYNLYVNGSLVVTESPSEGDTVINSWDIQGVSVVPGDIVRVSATNGVGEGPLSNPVIAEEI
jgi:hypothetical protein